MKLHFKKLFLALALFSVSIIVNGMPGPSAGGPPGGLPPAGASPAGAPPCWAPPCIPIDGGIGILLAAGAFVGARKLYKGTR